MKDPRTILDELSASLLYYDRLFPDGDADESCKFVTINDLRVLLDLAEKGLEVKA